MKKIKTFNEIIDILNNFWKKKSCIILQPTDHEVGAATFHPMTFVNAINKKEFNAAYTQISKRPSDLRHNDTSNRSTIFHQYQVIMKPSPDNIQDLYLDSLKKLGITEKENDIQFIEDNWQSPSLGAYGIGWEVRLNGTEITQFTYFQQMGDLECYPIMVEIAYGLERIALHMQKIDKIPEIMLNEKIRYKDIYLQYELELVNYIKFELNINDLISNFNKTELECEKLIKSDFIMIAYEKIINLSHIFNLIEAKKFISINDKYEYISKIRKLAKKIAEKIKNEKH